MWRPHGAIMIPISLALIWSDIWLGVAGPWPWAQAVAALAPMALCLGLSQLDVRSARRFLRHFR